MLLRSSFASRLASWHAFAVAILECANREMKMRTNVIGIFSNEEVIARLLGALMIETNDERAAARRYMSLEKLARADHNPTVRPLATAT